MAATQTGPATLNTSAEPDAIGRLEVVATTVLSVPNLIQTVAEPLFMMRTCERPLPVVTCTFALAAPTVMLTVDPEAGANGVLI